MIINKFTWLLIYCTLFFAAQLSAEQQGNQDIRKTFAQAEQQLWHPQSQSYQKLYNQLYFYPLRPYLDQQRLINQLDLTKIAEIDEFLTSYQGSPLDWPLRKAWLYYLAEQDKATLFLKFYRNSAEPELACYKLRFQLKTGLPKSVVLPQVTTLWQEGKSQPKVCDPLFQLWQRAGYRTEQLIWHRLTLAADGGDHTLIPYLTSLLPSSQHYLGELWHKVRRDPSVIAKLTQFKSYNNKEQQILVYGLKRLIWRDPEKALLTYHKAQQKFSLSEQQQAEISKTFALALASKNHALATSWLDKLAPHEMSEQLLQWRLALLLKQQEWQQIKQDLNAFPDSFKQQLKWRYWYARSLQETAQPTQAHQLFTELASQRHYYGFLAASFLSLPVSMQDQPIQATEQEKNRLLENPAAKRAFELFALQRFTQARREWDYWLSQLTNREKLIAAKIAYDKQWLDRAIFTLADVGYLDDVSLRFPFAFEQEINHFATLHHIDPAWAFAIARRESSFMADAHSSAGAKGLMQVLPTTAKQIAKRNINRRYLTNVNNNIKIGTRYLQQLLHKNKGNQILATAAYNAGPYRIKAWLKNAEKLPVDIWIETIPYTETREYVKSVLAYQQIYQTRIGQQGSVFAELQGMEISD